MTIAITITQTPEHIDIDLMCPPEEQHTLAAQIAVTVCQDIYQRLQEHADQCPHCTPTTMVH